jgi:hypothetical protein
MPRNLSTYPGRPGLPEMRGHGSGGMAGSMISRGMGMAKGGMDVGLGFLGLAGGVLGITAHALSLAKQYFEATNSITKAFDEGRAGIERYDKSIAEHATSLRMGRNELLQTEKAYLRVAGARQGLEKLSGAVHTAGQFALGMGLDVGQTSLKFAGLQQAGVHGGDSKQSTRQFAALLADAINQGGMRGREDELISSVQTLANAQLSVLTKPGGMAGILGVMTDMNASDQPGLQGARGAALLARMGEGIRNPQGELGELAMYQALARPGMNYFDFKYKQEEGLENLPEVMGWFSKAPGSAMQKSFMASSMLGVSMHQYNALSQAYGKSGDGRGLTKAMADAGVLESANGETLGVMSQMYRAGGDRTKIREALVSSNKFSGGDVEKIMSKGNITEMFQAMSGMKVMQTEGDKNAGLLSNIENILTGFGTAALPKITEFTEKTATAAEKILGILKPKEMKLTSQDRSLGLTDDRLDPNAEGGEKAGPGLGQAIINLFITDRAAQAVEIGTGNSPSDKDLSPRFNLQ